MQHSSIDPKAKSGEDARQMAVQPLFPTRDQAVEFPWSGSAARRRLVHGFDSRNASSRSFNLIRSKLVGVRRERGWRMIGVVSAAPNVGKSFVAANLSAALSRDPRFQTYLLDLDLRRGTIREIFGIETESGIVEYLEGSDPGELLSGFIPQGQDLVIIPSMAGLVASAELLASERATALFRAMRGSDEGNFFICDLPPVFANDDAAIIMEYLDGYIIVAQDGKTTQREVMAAADMLGHEQLAGVILNKYRGGLVSEGYGVEDRYASEYYSSPAGESED
jgi:Mrp family chromosome partitioning ATPase